MRPRRVLKGGYIAPVAGVEMHGVGFSDRDKVGVVFLHSVDETLACQHPYNSTPSVRQVLGRDPKKRLQEETL